MEPGELLYRDVTDRIPEWNAQVWSDLSPSVKAAWAYGEEQSAAPTLCEACDDHVARFCGQRECDSDRTPS